MRTPLLLILGATALAGPLGAQAPADRDSIESFRATLAAVDDSLVLLQREADLIELARADRDNAGPPNWSRNGRTRGTDWGWPSWRWGSTR
jgi:hypothetical protein